MKRSYLAAARRRLVGTWRSDARKTMEGWVFPRRLASKRVREFHAIFGKMTWRFTSRGFMSTYEDVIERGRYSILWASEHSAVVLFSAREGETCHHLFFDEKWFFLVAGARGNVEYFRKVLPKG